MNLKQLKELESKATPGPWMLGEDDRDPHIYVHRTEHSSWAILSMRYGAVNDENNAPLIAEMRNQLPQLLSWAERALDLCKRIESEGGHGHNVHEKARELIKEAEGE